jgi:hypothetical protein
MSDGDRQMTPIHTKVSYDPRGFDALVCVLADQTEGGTLAYRWLLRAYEGQSIPELTQLALENGEPLTAAQCREIFGHQDDYAAA